VEKLAAQLAMSPSTIFAWENGGAAPDPHSLTRLADGLNCPSTFLAPLPRRPTLADYRQRAGMTQDDIGATLGVSRALVARIERGCYWPAGATRWAKAYGLTLKGFAEAWRPNPNPPRQNRPANG